MVCTPAPRRAEKRDGGLFAAPSAEREDAFGVAVRAHLQAIEVLRLRAEPGVGDLDVVVALRGESEVDARVETRARAVVAARKLLACAVENAQHRVDGRPAAPRLDFEDAPLAGLAGDAEDVTLGAAQRAVDDHGGWAHGLGGLDRVVAIGQRVRAAIPLR